MIRLLIVFLILGVLGGCSVMDGVRKNFYMTDEEKLAEKEARFAEHREKCTELGFNPEYVEHTNCVLGLEQSWIEAKAVKSAADSIWIHSSSQSVKHCAPDYVTGGCL
jgi:hypothetical protein